MTDFALHQLLPTGGTASKGYAATIGFFDGVHLGHRFLLQHLRTLATERGLAPLVLTFDHHPRAVLGQRTAPRLLTPTAEKLRLLAEEGIGHCAVLHFTPRLAAYSAAAFMDRYLHHALHVRTLLIGHDHHFGRPAPDEGFDDYVRYGQQLGIEVICADRFQLDSAPNLKISSSAIRLLLEQGNVADAAILLGRPHRLSGTVVMGRQNGRRMGFPTANLVLEPAEQLLPHLGVYATRVHLASETMPTGTMQSWPAMTNIGRRPTLDNGEDITFETHLLDYQGDLYGSHLNIDFIARIRDEKRFDGLEALTRQIADDADTTRRILNRP